MKVLIFGRAFAGVGAAGIFVSPLRWLVGFNRSKLSP